MGVSPKWVKSKKGEKKEREKEREKERKTEAAWAKRLNDCDNNGQATGGP